MLTPFFISQSSRVLLRRIATYMFARSRMVRVVVSLICVFHFLLWTPGEGVRGFLWFLAIPAAPYFTITALAGRQDGEFYAEGFLVITAIGWWMMIWCALLIRESFFAKRWAVIPVVRARVSI